MLTALYKTGRKTENGQYFWMCRCDCGNETEVRIGNIRFGRTKSCGCLQRRKGEDAPAYKHGRSRTKDYYNELVIKQNYGIEYSDYLNMVEVHDNKCAICGAEAPTEGHKKRLNIDHCHETGQVRGLLCDLCNRALGLMRDNTEFLSNAIKYLNQYSLAR